MRTVTVTAQRSGKWWVLECQEAGAVSQVHSLSQASDDMREAIAFQLGISEDDFDIKLDIILPPQYERELERSQALYRQSELTLKAASEARQQAARELAKLHLSVRDIGQVMGISYQRAHQLIRAEPHARQR